MPEVINIPVFLETLRANDKYREEFTAIAQDIKADIVSFQSNPKCGCRRKIHDFVVKNVETEPVKNFLNKWKPEVANLFFEPQAIKGTLPTNITSTPNGPIGVTSTATPVVPNNINRPPQKLMSGHVVEIPVDVMEYKKLMEHTKTDLWMYRGLTVKDGVSADGKPVWLVFFY